VTSRPDSETHISPPRFAVAPAGAMCACPVPYIFAGAWLMRKIPEVAKHRRGRAALAVTVCGASAAFYLLQRRWRRRRERLSVGLELGRFGLSDHGFVPHAGDVLRRLPAQFAAWEEVADRLAELTRSHRLRDVVDSWPCLDAQPLLSCGTRPDDYEDERFSRAARRAYAVLAMIAHSYVWCDRANPRRALPEALAVPLHAVASHLGLPPVLTHAALDLWNWRPTAPADGEPTRGAAPQDAFRCINTMTGTRDEEWFYCSSTAVQVQAAAIVLGAYDLLAEAIVVADTAAVGDFLALCADRLELMASTLSKLAEHCTSEVFWGEMRPLLQGFGYGTSLPEGLIYTGVRTYGGRPQRFAGASAAQSTAIPVIDAVFGVAHGRREAAFMSDMRRYMPTKHREFLEMLQRQPSLREVLLGWRNGVCESGVPCPTPEEVSALVRQFNICVERLANFRRSHWRLVGSHILKPKSAAEEAAAASARCAGAGCNGSRKGSNAALGTGGSPLETFLQSTVVATLAARI